MRQVLNFGSLNIDRVLGVERIARPGETVASRSHAVFAGGKGANQSVALARAGATVFHAGKIGEDGRWLLDKLAADGVDTRHVRVTGGVTGQAFIQVDEQGQNSIVLLAGANREITRAEIDETLAQFGPDTLVLVQNETNEVAYVISRASERGLPVCFNPAPFGPEVLDYPLDRVGILIVNETEGEGLTGKEAADEIVAALAARLPDCEIILTLGSRGAIYQGRGQRLHVAAPQVAAVDTTAAGDTFIGYYLASRAGGMTVADSLQRACRAAAICVTRAGAIDSIPKDLDDDR